MGMGRKSRTRFVKFSLILTACLGGLTACDGEEMPQNAALVAETQYEKSPDLLSRALYSAHLQLDPVLVKVVADAAPLRDLYEGLMMYDRHGRTVEGIARNYFTDDGKNWLFILGENARWSNGEAVTAEDFVASWQRLADPASRSPSAGYLSKIRLANAALIQQQKLSPEMLGIKALNAQTLQIQLEEANFELPKLLAHFALLPTYQGRPVGENPITNGAYQISAKESKRLILKSSEPHRPFKTVVYQLITTVQNPARFDIVENPLPDYDRHQIYLPRLCNYVYQFDFRQPLSSQKNVRQAVKAMLSSTELGGHIGVRNHSVLPLSLWKSAERQLSMTGLEQYLSKLGVKPGEPLKINLVFEPNEQNNKVANVMARMLSQSDLFRVNLSPVPDRGDAKEGITLRQAEFCADDGDPLRFLKPFHSDDPENLGGYSNEQIDRWLDEIASGNLSKEVKEEKIAAIVKALESDIALLPLFQPQRRMVIDPTISGVDKENTSEVVYSKDLSRQPIKDKQ